MKKALLIGLVLGLAVGLAVPAMAVDLTASGYIGMRGYVFRNAMAAAPLFVEWTGPPPGTMHTPAWGARAGMNDEMGAFINSRAELGFTVRASEDLYGFIKFRMDSDHFGTDSDERYGVEGGGAIAVQVQELFIDFKIPPGLPVWARVGLQPVAIRPWIFMFNDAPGVSLRTMIDPIKLSATAYYVKMADPDNWAAVNGAEFWAIDTKIPLSFGSVNIAPGIFFAYEDIRSDALDPLGGYFEDPLWLGCWPDNTTLWWVGANFDGGVGPVKFQFDFIYNGGEIPEAYASSVWDIDVSSWLVNGMVSFMFKKFEVGVAGKYITGEDYTDGLPLGTSETFYLPGERNFTPTGYASEALAISGDFIVFDNGWFTQGPGWPGMGLIDGPSCYWPGIWNARMFVYYQATDWLRLGAQFGYIGDTVSDINVVWTGYGGDAIGNDLDDDDSIGWEFDFGVNIQLYKNLALETGFGYLIAHKALSQEGGYAPADPWALQSRLMYFF